MTITSILVYVDTSPDSDERVDVAVRLARRCDAYLTAAGLEEAAMGPRERFSRMLHQEQVQGEWQTIIGLPVSHMARHAAGHDLLVLGQRNPNYSTGLDTPEDVVLGCGRPVLVVPYGRHGQPGRRPCPGRVERQPRGDARRPGRAALIGAERRCDGLARQP